MKETNYKIVFWGEGDIPSNLAAVASYMAFYREYEVALRRTAGELNLLRNCFSSKAVTGEEQKELLLMNPGKACSEAKYKFVDCGKRTDEWARQLMRRADLVVINLPQTAEAFDTFFLQYVRFSTKVLYLVGSYQKEAYYNRLKLQHVYRIPTEQIAVIPFNPEFQLACEKGILDRYMCREVSFHVTENRRYFMRELENAMCKMIEQL